MGYNHYRYARPIGNNVGLYDPANTKVLTYGETSSNVAKLLPFNRTDCYLQLAPLTTDAIKLVCSIANTDATIGASRYTILTGTLKYGTHNATGDVACNGYIEIVDSGGTTRKLMTTA